MLILINHNGEREPLSLPAGARLVVGDYAGGGLPGHGVAVVEWPER